MTEEQQSEFHEEAAEQPADEAPEHEEAPEETPEETHGETGDSVSIGHPAVDEVLRSLDALGDAPVDEHVAVFEQAHEQLRRTLQGAGDDE